MSAAVPAREDAVLERIDRLYALLAVALGPQLDAGREQILADPIDRAVLDAAREGWIAAAGLLAAVESATGKKKSSIKAHTAVLLERGLLKKRGEAKATEYASAGVL